MFNLRHIETFDAPELAPYRTMRRPMEHHAQGIFVAEGDKVVKRLLRDPAYGIISVVLPPERVPMCVLTMGRYRWRTSGIAGHGKCSLANSVSERQRPRPESVRKRRVR